MYLGEDENGGNVQPQVSGSLHTMYNARTTIHYLFIGSR